MYTVEDKEQVRLTEFMEGPSISFPEMRNIQQEAFNAYMRSGKKKAILAIPVGSGKSLLSLRIWDALGRPHMLIVVPRIVLIKNPWLKEMTKIGIPPDSVGTYYSEEKIIKKPITITLYQSLLRNREVLKEFSFVVFDEAHLLGGEAFGSLLHDIEGADRVIGMTGTIRDAMRQNPEIVRVLPIVYERTIGDARAKKVLAPAVIRPVYSELGAKEANTYRKLSFVYNGMLKRGFGENSWFKRVGILKQAAIINRRRLTILSNSPEKFKQAIEIMKQDPKSPTLIFGESVKGIEQLKSMLEKEGIASKTITHKISRGGRQDVISGFGSKFYALLSVDILSLGFDVPQCGRMIVLASGKGATKIEQRMGRVLRIDPDNSNKVAQIFVLVAKNTQDEKVLENFQIAYTRIRERPIG